MTRSLRPDTGFVLHLSGFTDKVIGGYRCTVFEGAVTKLGEQMSGAAALAYLAAHPHTVVNVLHV